MFVLSQELKYSKEDVEQTWKNLHDAKVELETYESRDSEKKKEIIARIRDSVRILVYTKSIPIKKSQTMAYCSNILSEKNISYSKGHISELFNDDEKRNYSKSSQGNIHEHEFDIISESDGQKWEQCQCGTNRINGILQENVKDAEESTPHKETIREIIEPNGINFEYLKQTRELFSQYLHAIDLIVHKCTLDITAIKKQTTEHKRRKAPQIEYDKLLESSKALVEKRINIVNEELGVDKNILFDRKKEVTQ